MWQHSESRTTCCRPSPFIYSALIRAHQPWFGWAPPIRAQRRGPGGPLGLLRRDQSNTLVLVHVSGWWTAVWNGRTGIKDKKGGLSGKQLGNNVNKNYGRKCTIGWFSGWMRVHIYSSRHPTILLIMKESISSTYILLSFVMHINYQNMVIP
jgi:hypothetical protein